MEDNSDDILPQNEIDDLLFSLTGSGEGEQTGGDTEAPAGELPEVSMFDLKRPGFVSQSLFEKFKVWSEELGEKTAGLWGIRFGVPCSIEVRSIDALTYDEYIRSAPEKGCFIRFDSGWDKGASCDGVFFSIPLYPAMLIYRCVLGYPLSEGPAAEDPMFGPVPDALAGFFADTAGKAAGFSDVSSFALSERIRAASPVDQVIIPSFNVHFGGGIPGSDFTMDLCIPRFVFFSLFSDRMERDIPPDIPDGSSGVLTGTCDYLFQNITRGELLDAVRNSQPLTGLNVKSRIRFSAGGD